MSLNRAKDIGDALLSEVQLACNAMDTLRNRYLDRDRIVMTGPEKVAIRLGLDYLEDMVRNSSPCPNAGCMGSQLAQHRRHDGRTG